MLFRSVGFGMGFPMGFELILSCFVLILSYFWFGFVDFVFGLLNVEIGFVDFVDCGGRPMIVGWCCVCSNTMRAEQREEMRGMRNRREN